MAKRPQRFADGETLMACSICGFTCLYPSQIRYLDDKQFWCFRHPEYESGYTAYTDGKIRSGWRPPIEQVPGMLGPTPTWRDDG